MRKASAGLLAVLFVLWSGTAAESPALSDDGALSFSSWVVVQNPSADAATVGIVYATPCDPATPDYTAVVPSVASDVVSVGEAFPGPWGAAAMVSSDVPVVATQTFLWSDAGGSTQWASHGGGVPVPSRTWYLGEATTYGEFESYVFLWNPGPDTATAQITYLLPGETRTGPQVTLNPTAQKEIPMSEAAPDAWSASAVVTADAPIVAFLSTYNQRDGASFHQAGVPTPATSWYLAEGTTEPWSGFETWIVVQNPNDTPATVGLAFQSEGVLHPGPTQTIPPMTHAAWAAADSFPNRMQFTTVVTSDVPVVATQTRTWDNRHGIDSTLGAPSPSSTWYFPAGPSHTEAESWLVLINPGSEPVRASIDFLTPGGPFGAPPLTLDPLGRDSISLPPEVNGQMTYSVAVTSDTPILVLQGTYWETASGSHQDTSFGVTSPATTWYLPPTPHRPQPMDSGSAGQTEDGDRDGDGVPDGEDLCPDFPGAPATSGC
ncbi:MAG: DUF5719 family protein [Candidatus Bipolaricaulota bacterium]